MSRRKLSAKSLTNVPKSVGRPLSYGAILLLPIVLIGFLSLERAQLSEGKAPERLVRAASSSRVAHPFQSSTPELVKEFIFAGSLLLATSEPTKFEDVPLSHPFHADITKIAQLEVTLGTTATLYSPDGIVNRTQMAIFICRALGYHTPEPPAPGSGAPHFTDVPTTHSFYNFVEKIYSLGITIGCTPTTYCPNDPVSHGQMAAFMTRACGQPAPPLGEAPWRTPDFADVPPNHPFYALIHRYAGRQIWPGCSVPNSTNNFCPDAGVRRDEMAYILARNFNYSTPTLPRSCP